MRFCRTSQMSQKTSKMEPRFRKTLSSQACNCTKKDTVTGDSVFSCEYIYANIFFHFLHFCFRKDQYLFNNQSSFTSQNKAFEQKCK